MTESHVTVTVNGKDYPMACSPGEEEKVTALGKQIDETVRKVATATGPIGEARVLVMAALIIADRCAELEKKGDKADSLPLADTPANAETDAKADAKANAKADAKANTELVKRIESLAMRIEKLASSGASS